MSDTTYNGWTNRETWAVALHVNNDQGWQESVHESVRDVLAEQDPQDAAHAAEPGNESEDTVHAVSDRIKADDDGHR